MFFVTSIVSAINVLEENIPLIDIVYEVVSAFSTTGLTVGITTSLSDISKILLSIAMFIGRVGPISLILAVTIKQQKRGSEKILPESQVVVG